MKKINIKIFAWVMSLSILTSCFGDLDVTPLDPNTVISENLYNTEADYLMGLAKLYAGFGMSGALGPNGNPDFQGFDEGFSTYMRGWWNAQEITTDEAVSRGDAQAGLPDFHFQSWTPTNSYLSIIHARILYNVAVCNEFIRNATNSGFAEVDQYVAEARFLRAMYYWHALDLFGTAPFVTETELPGAFFPEQASSVELFDYIEAELKEIDASLGAPGFQYGRIDQAAAWMVLSKLYLNAEVYIGSSRYDEAIVEMDKITSDGAFSLATEHRHNFVADNNTSPEIIFPIMFDATTTQSWGGTTYLLAGAMGGGSITALETIGVTAQWGILRTTSALVNLFETLDVRSTFWSDGQFLEIEDIELFSNGYMSTKFKNRKLNGNLADSQHSTHPDTDFPLFRLGDVYLMYAEAVVRGGSGDMGTALGYVNALRTRAGVNTVSSLDLDFLLDERARELFWEGHRRTDLIRFGQFTDGSKIWPWKGGAADGVAVPGYRDVFPVPSTQIAANPNLEQNDGY
ncbi:MAG: RagB/SusD family nutrient uptake outer membrane protein [Reichenbachiella sp.]